MLNYHDFIQVFVFTTNHHLKRVKVRSTACHYASKRPFKLSMYLDLDIIITLKFTTNVDGCAILNVLNCLTKNFDSISAYS